MARIYLSPPDLDGDERDRVFSAIESNWVAPLGPEVDGFETEVAARMGRAHAAAVTSGTAAIHLGLLLMGVGPGDEVVVPTMTFIATANAVAYTGAVPVFVDVDPGTANLDVASLAELLSDRAAAGRLPKAVITVDLYGQCADYDAIVPLCEHYGVPILEDAAEALGASWKGAPAGSFGRFGVMSFNGNKIITTSGGGMLASDDEAAIVRARHLATQARDPAPYYQHTEIGFNYRMSNLLAALGRGQLARLDHKIAVRTQVRDRYVGAFGDLPLTALRCDPRGVQNCWLSVFRIDEGLCAEAAHQGDPHEPVLPVALCEHLGALDIEARPVWKPLHLQPVFASNQMVDGEGAQSLFRSGVCLPSGSSLTLADQDRVIAAVHEFFSGRLSR